MRKIRLGLLVLHLTSALYCPAQAIYAVIGGGIPLLPKQNETTKIEPNTFIMFAGIGKTVNDYRAEILLNRTKVGFTITPPAESASKATTLFSGEIHSVELKGYYDFLNLSEARKIYITAGGGISYLNLICTVTGPEKHNESIPTISGTNWFVGFGAYFYLNEKCGISFEYNNKNYQYNDLPLKQYLSNTHNLITTIIFNL